jgi:hypothetical protein
MMSQSKQWVFGIKPSGLIILVILLSLSGIAGWLLKEHHPTAVLFEPQIESIQSAPLCPWREPTADLRSFFPSATRYEAETHILSGLRIQLSQLLGRAPTGDENALHIYRIYDLQTPLGMVLTQRVKGAYGAIELVLGVDLAGRVCGVRLQRNRELESVAAALQRSEWLGTFIGKTANDGWQLGEDIPAVAEEARLSADAIVQGARSLLILLRAANDPHSRNLIAKPHH